MGWSASLAAGPFDPQQEYSDFLSRSDEDGAVVTFLGIARPRSRKGEPVERLLLDHHPKLTQASLNEISNTATVKFPVTRVCVVHRYGSVDPTEPIVWVAVAATHRRAAFEAADYLMDRLKTDAVFWKREDGANSSCWIEPTEADRAERARWSE